MSVARASLLASMMVCAPALWAVTPEMHVVAMSLTGSLPKGVSISPDGHTLYVTNYGNANGSNVFLYNAETLERTGQIDIPGIVVESALSPDGRMLYVSNFRRNTVQFVDLRTRRVRREVRAGAHPKVLALSRDGRRLFVANWSSASVTELDVARGTVTRTLRAGRNPRGMVMTAAGRLYIANFNGHTLDVYDGPTLSEHRRVTPLCRIPRHLALSPDDARLYVSCFSDSKLLVLSTQSDSIEREVSIGNWPKSIDVSADGRYVFSADYGGSSVSLVDTQDWSSATLDVPWMDHGSGVVAARRGHRFYATGWYDNHVFAVDFSQGITGLTPSDAMRALTLRRRDFHRLHPTE